MLDIYPVPQASQMHFRANDLMKHNIDALLRARGQTQKDLAMWCRRSESWISKILKEPNREFPMKYFDRIADFFGLATYQLLQPGISSVTERRSGFDRRSGRDRRVGHAIRTAMDIRSALPLRSYTGLPNDAEVKKGVREIQAIEREQRRMPKGQRRATSKE